ncbi:MAG: riboflavin synthase [Firmicutes bacterium]|nr:riboflavin synthase [Bacillota bacterium]
MFTGIVEAVGEVIALVPDADQVSRRLAVASPLARDLELGESVSVNGVCLTVIAQTDAEFFMQISPTTLRLTTLGGLRPGQRVNLERSVTPATRLGGHWVLGHVDTVGRIQAVTPEGEARHVEVAFPPEYGRWVLPQGSIAIDGVSLTIVKVGEGSLTVTLIPHTLAHTILSHWQSGTAVNLEFDVLGKFVEHLLAPYRAVKEG